MNVYGDQHMKLSDVKIGTELEMVEGGGTYRVVRIEGDEIELENVKFVSGVGVYLDDLPEMFEEVGK